MLAQRLDVGGMFGAVLREGLDVQFMRFLHVLDQVVEADLTAVEGHHHPSQDGVDLRQVDPDDLFEAILHVPGDELVAGTVNAAHLDVGAAMTHPGTPGNPAAAWHGQRPRGGRRQPAERCQQPIHASRPPDAPDRLVETPGLIRPLLPVGLSPRSGQELMAAFASTGEESHRRSIACITRQG